MNAKMLAVGLAMGLVMAVVIGRAEALTIPNSGSFSGSFVNTEIDTNGDGGKAALQMVDTKGTLGSSSIRGVNEFAFSAEATCQNGNAGFEFTLVSGGPAQFVQRFNSTGDLLFQKLTSSTECFDPTTGINFFSAEGNFTGGTGKFAGATGSFTVEGTATVLFFDAAKGNFFGEESGTFTGTIITP